VSGDSLPDAATIAARFSKALDSADKKTVRRLLAENVLIYEGGGVESSLEEYASHHMTADMAFLSGLKREVLSQKIFDHGDMVVVSTLTRLHGNYQEKPIDSKSAETLLLERRGDDWKIVHIHWSAR